MKTKDQLIQLGIEEFKADEIMLLQEKMMEQAVKFQFRKKDDSIRDAVGTLCRKLMKQQDGTLWEPIGESRPEPSTVINFFDCAVGMWRCFTCTSFVGLVNA